MLLREYKRLTRCSKRLALDVNIDPEPALKKLIVHLTYQMVASWDFRITKKIKEFPMLFLKFLEKPCDENDPHRQELARRLNNEPDCCLASKSKWSDVPVELKQFHWHDFQHVEQTGQVPRKLYITLMMFRSQLFMDTQDLEGANSVLQHMAKAAPNMRIPLASDRLKIKCGDPLPPSEACTLNTLVRDHMRTPEYMDRFAAPTLEPAAIPIETPERSCVHQMPSAKQILAARFALTFFQKFSPGATKFCF